MKKSDSAALRFISEVAGGKKIYILILLLVQSILGISSVFYALFLRNIIDGAVAHDGAGLLRAVLFFALLMLLQIALRAVVRYVEELSKSTYENAFKDRLFLQILIRDYGSVTAVHSGEWMNTLTSDTVIVSEGLATILPGICGMIVKLCGALAAILVLEPRFGYILIPGGLILAVLTYVFRKRLKALHKEMREKDGQVRISLQEFLNSLMIVKAFSREDDARRAISGKMQEHKKARIRKNHFSNISNIGFSGIMQGAYLLGAVYGAYGIYSGTLSYGTMMAILQLISQVQNPFANITGYLPRYYAMVASAERLMAVEDYAEDRTAQGNVPEWEHIGLENVDFSYKNSGEDGETREVLKGVSLTVKKGEFVTFTGPSGCGKSTVLKLLMGLYRPDSGSLLTDDRRLFAYVPQGNVLMRGTIREVISFAAQERKDDDAALFRRLETACAKGFVQELPEGLDFVLGERGCGLSEGQMQRLSIARALISGRPVLLLDEATSALDEATAGKLLKNLRELEDVTLILVTHRTGHRELFDKEIRFSAEGIRVISGQGEEK